MAIDLFGQYQVIEELPPKPSRLFYRVRRAGQADQQEFLLQIFEPDAAFVDESEATTQIEEFLKLAQHQQTLATAHPDRWVGVVDFGRIERGQFGAAYSAAEFCPRSAIDFAGTADAQALRAIISGVLESLDTLHRQSMVHGRVQAPWVRLRTPGNTPIGSVLLTEPSHARATATASDRAHDLRGLGELILYLVTGEARAPHTNFVQPSAAWTRPSLAKTGDAWRELCNRLLSPDLTRQPPTIDQLRQALPQEGAKSSGGTGKMVGLAAAVILLLALAGGGVWFFLSPGKSTDSTTTISSSSSTSGEALRDFEQAYHLWLKDLVIQARKAPKSPTEKNLKTIFELIKEEKRDEEYYQRVVGEIAQLKPATDKDIYAEYLRRNSGRSWHKGCIEDVAKIRNALKELLKEVQQVKEVSRSKGCPELANALDRIGNEISKITNLDASAPAAGKSVADESPAPSVPLAKLLLQADFAVAEFGPRLKKLNADSRISTQESLPAGMLTKRSDLQASLVELLNKRDVELLDNTFSSLADISKTISTQAKAIANIRAASAQFTQPAFKEFPKRLDALTPDAHGGFRSKDLDDAQQFLDSLKELDRLCDSLAQIKDDPFVKVPGWILSEFPNTKWDQLPTWSERSQKLCKQLQKFHNEVWTAEGFVRDRFVKDERLPSQLAGLEAWLTNAEGYLKIAGSSDPRAVKLVDANQNLIRAKDSLTGVPPEQKAEFERQLQDMQSQSKAMQGQVWIEKERKVRIDEVARFSESAKKLRDDIERVSKKPADWLDELRVRNVSSEKFVASQPLREEWDRQKKRVGDPARLRDWEKNPSEFHQFRREFDDRAVKRLNELQAALETSEADWPQEVRNVYANRRETALRNIVASLEKNDEALLADQTRFDSLSKTELEKFGGWRTSVKATLDMAQAVSQAFSLCYGLTDKPAGKDDTLASIYVRLTKESAYNDLKGLAPLTAVNDIADALGKLPTAEDALLENIKDPKKPLVVRWHAWSRWQPRGIEGLKTDLATQDALRKALASLPEPRRNELLSVLSRESSTRWQACVIRLDSWKDRQDALEPAILKKVFPPDGHLPGDVKPEVVWIDTLFKLRQAAKDSAQKKDQSDENVKSEINQWLSKLPSAPAYTAQREELVNRLRKLTTGSNDSASGKSLESAGPGFAGWTAKVRDNGELVTYTSPDGQQSLTFRKFKAAGEVRSDFYLSTTEMSVSVFANIVNQTREPSAPNLLKKLLASARNRSESEWCFPRTWSVNDAGQQVQIESSWIDTSVTDWQGAERAFPGEQPPSGAPNINHPVQMISPYEAAVVAALIGCRIPQVNEWRLAAESTALQSPAPPVLRGKRFAEQWNHVKTVLGARTSRPWPNAGALAVLTGSEREGADPENPPGFPIEDTFYFAPVQDGTRSDEGRMNRMIGNVAEYVTEKAPPRTLPGEALKELGGSTWSQNFGTIYAIGGSSLSPVPAPLDKLKQPAELINIKSRRPLGERGFSDVGLRPCFTAPIDPLADQWVKLLNDENPWAFIPKPAQP